ncbi:MAG: putative DNA binding domain-containing protein [Chloroflexi bacterium]|nr:putative DNA binding domain-containing protein [Chloroflexota bacterium]
MLSDAELLGMMADLESDRAERKSSLSDRDKIRQAICAFANDLPGHDRPGVVFVGVHDSGTCAHLSITDDLLLTLADMRSDGNILPFPIMTVQKRELHGCDVAVLEVQPSYNPPVRYNGRTWIRVGPRRATATAEEERRLSERRRWRDLPYDQQPMPPATIADLDLDLFRRDYLPAAVAPEVLEENRRGTEDQLAALRFLTPAGQPNVAALLVFGKDPIRWIPAAYIQFLRLDGMEITDPIRDQKELNGPLTQVLRQLDELLGLNISTSSDVQSGSLEVRSPDYPLVALQQLSRNAVLHRSYESTNAPVRIYWFDDRVEIYNPGGLYGQVNQQNFGRPGITDYRNPLLAEAMKVLGYVQRFGMGIPLARKQLAGNGNPPPEFQFEVTGVLATVRRRP